jgi:hypothetical protein
MNDSYTFNITKAPNFWLRLWLHINDFLFYQLFIIILIDNYENLIIWALYIFITIFSLRQSITSRKRIILKIQIDTIKKEIQIDYIHFFKIKSILNSFEHISYTYKKVSYGRLKTPYTLTLFQNKKIIMQFIKGISYGWDAKQIDELNNLLQGIYTIENKDITKTDKTTTT